MILKKLLVTIKHIVYTRRVETVKQLFKFGLVGLLNTLVGYLAYLVFLFLDFHYLWALLIGQIIAVTNSFLCNRVWTFKSRNKWTKECWKFFLIYFLALLLNVILLSWLVEMINLGPKIAQLIAGVIITILTFLGQKFWTFKMIIY